MTAHLCPWLGTEADPEIRHLEPSEVHVCYARAALPAVDLDYQERSCLRGAHRTCKFYRKPPEQAPPVHRPAAEVEDEFGPPPRSWPIARPRGAFWLPWVLAALAVAAVLVYFGSVLLRPQPAVAPGTTAALVVAASPGVALPPGSLPALPTDPLDQRESPALEFVEPTATPTPYPGGAVYGLSPAAGTVGWVASDETRGNHLGDSYLYTGLFDGVTYHGALQFDLSAVPRGTTIHAATLELTGLDVGRLGDEGVWQVRILAREAGENWGRVTFQDLHNAPVQWTLLPALGAGDLDEGGINAFVLSQEQLRELEQRLLDEHPIVSVRLDGPLAGEDSLFAWDSGYGPATRNSGPRLHLSVGPPPGTPLPGGSPSPTATPEWVVVTSTPTPANAMTAAAIALRETARATTTGPATATSQFLATATPEWILVTSTPTAENSATAASLSALATANVVLTGTPTPAPPNLATPQWIVVTSTPTPGNAVTAAAVALRETARAAGPATPTSPFVITATPRYVVVTRTPTPQSRATDHFLRSVATANVVLTGTPTPTPANLATATFTPLPTRTRRPTVTPVLLWLDEMTMTPVPSSTPEPAQPPIPPILRNKIAFLSDRLGDTAAFVLDPTSRRVAFLTDRWPYDQAKAREGLSPDGKYVASVGSGVRGLQIYVTDLKTGVSWAVTFAQALSYDPAWSPRGDIIAYVSQETGPQTGSDEIFTVDPQGAGKQRLTFNTWEWDKHPTFSPDGSQIVFWSNQTTGSRQLWIMNVDGSERRILLNSPYNDWDPVWIK